MATSVLIFLGEKLKFKMGKNSVFGAHRNQFVAIHHKGQQGYSIVFRVKRESLSMLKTIMTKDYLRKITSKKFLNLNINDESLVVFGLGENIFSPKKTAENLQKYINILIDEIERHQAYTEALTEKTVLVEGIPSPNTNSVVSEAQEKLNSESRKPIDRDKGIFFGIPMVILIGIALGLFSAWANTHGQDLNPFAKGLIAISASAGLFRYLAGGLDKNSRIIVGVMGLTLFLTWDMSRIFFYWLLKSEKQLNFEELINIYKNSLMNFDTLGKFAAIAVITTLIGIFLIKRTDRSSLDVQDGIILEDDHLTQAKNILRGQKNLGFVFLGYLFFLLTTAFLFLDAHEYKNWDYISYKPFLFIYFATFIVLWGATYIVIFKKFHILKLGIQGFENGITRKFNVSLLISMLAAIPSFSVCFLITYLNMKSVSLEPVSMSAVSSQDYYFEKDKCSKVDFHNAEIARISYKLCKSDVPIFLPKGTEAKFKYSKGNFDIPFIYNFSIPSFSSFQNYMAVHPNQKELRYYIVSYFLKHDQSEWFKEIQKGWRRDCEREASFHCRLTAYIYEFEDKKAEGFKYYTKGCFNSKDAYACRGYNSYKGLSLDRKKAALEEIEKICKSGKLDYCAELGWSMIEMNIINKEKLINLFEKPCSAGNKDACLTLDSLKEKKKI